jgi:flagellar hook-associated protein 3 FlgL
LRASESAAASPPERAMIADEIDKLIDTAKEDANARYAGRSLFAGAATGVAPYNQGDDDYHGDTGDIVRTIGPGVSVVVNVRASAFLGTGTDGKMINTLRDISAHLRSDAPADQAALSGSDLVAIDRSLDAVLTAQAQVGTVANRLSAADDRLAELQENARGLLSKTEDGDMAETLIRYSTQQSVYQSALRAGAGIVQASLLDFLR